MIGSPRTGIGGPKKNHLQAAKLGGDGREEKEVWSGIMGGLIARPLLYRIQPTLMLETNLKKMAMCCGCFLHRLSTTAVDCRGKGKRSWPFTTGSRTFLGDALGRFNVVQATSNYVTDRRPATCKKVASNRQMLRCPIRSRGGLAKILRSARGVIYGCTARD